MLLLVISLALFLIGIIVFFITDDLDIMEIGLNLIFVSLLFAILGALFIITTSLVS